MKEYIERGELESILHNRYDRLAGLRPDFYAGYMMAFHTIEDDVPTAADVVEVVRCRECKYWGDEDGKLQRSDGLLFARCIIHNYLLDGRHTGWCPTENNFCSYGEREGGAD